MVVRREFLRFGIAGSVWVLGRHLAGGDERSQQPTGYLASTVHAAHPLEFRLDSDYVPDLSDAAERRLSRAVLDFLYAEHPEDLTMSLWDLNPRQMPYLKRHLELVVEHVFGGVRDHLEVRPVDPIVVLSLLYNESRFHPKAVSPAGAVGMAQFMPETAVEYGLEPIARQDAWKRYQEARRKARADRNKRIREFKRRFGVRSFRADAVIDRAIETGDVKLLADYRKIADAPDETKEAQERYVDAIEEALGAYEFFWDGMEPLAAIDGRVSYAAASAAVGYIARSLRAHQGMASTAVASYNAGLEAVRVRNPDSILYRFGDIPNYAETIRYVQRFLAVYSAIKYRVFALGG